MIPIKIQIQGFLSYKENVEINFEPLHLASITGQNGAGKSSILDAMTWVLFGYARARNDQVINQQSDTAQVSLDFEYEKQFFRVRRTKQFEKNQILEFYIREEETQSWRSLTEHTVNETQKRIQQTLLMDYDTFVNASFFLQGKADQFTQLSPRERKSILSNILGLEIWENYHQKAKEFRKVLESHENRLEAILVAIKVELSNESQVLQQSKDIQKELDEKTKFKFVQQQLLEQANQIDLSKKYAESQLEQLSQDADKINSNLIKNKNQKRDLVSQLEILNAQIDKANQIEENYKKWRDYRQILDDLNQNSVLYQKLSQQLLTLQHEITTEYNTLENQKTSLEKRHHEIEQHLKVLPEEERELDELLKKQEENQESISKKQAIQEKIQSLRAELSGKQQNIKHLEEVNQDKRNQLKKFRDAGPDCPFCNQPLTPVHREKYEALIISEGLDRKSKIEQETSAINKLNEEVINSRELIRHIEQIEKETSQILHKITEKRININQMKNSIEDWQNNQAEKYKSILDNLENRQFENKYQEKLTSLEAEIQSIKYDEAEHETIRKLENELRYIEEDYRNLMTARGKIDPLSNQLKQILVELANYEKEFSDKSQQLENMRLEYNKLYANTPDINQLKSELNQIDIEISQISRRFGAEKQKLDIIERKKIEKEKVQSELDQIITKISRYKKLEEAFGKNGVPALLIEQALPEIESHANELLDRLTFSQLSIHFETQSEYKDKKRQDKKETLDILINDANGQTRAYELFSGGEAFRINFAIRLALSQVLAKRSGARLQTLVIDEGFGSQDHSGRSRLVETINLVKKDFSKILIITHLEELKDAFPGRIEVEKTPSGSRVDVMVY